MSQKYVSGQKKDQNSDQYKSSTGKHGVPKAFLDSFSQGINYVQFASYCGRLCGEYKDS